VNSSSTWPNYPRILPALFPGFLMSVRVQRNEHGEKRAMRRLVCGKKFAYPFGMTAARPPVFQQARRVAAGCVPEWPSHLSVNDFVGRFHRFSRSFWELHIRAEAKIPKKSQSPHRNWEVRDRGRSLIARDYLRGVRGHDLSAIARRWGLSHATVQSVIRWVRARVVKLKELTLNGREP